MYYGLKIFSVPTTSKISYAYLRGFSRLYRTAQHYGVNKPNTFIRSRLSVQSRLLAEASVPPCPPPKKKKGGFGFKGTLALALLGTGAVVAYAKYDDDFRDYVKESWPGFDEFIKVVTMEEKSYIESLQDLMGSVTDSVEDAKEETAAVIRRQGEKRPAGANEIKPGSYEAERTTSVSLPPPPPPTVEVVEKKAEPTPTITKAAGDVKPCPPIPPTPKDLVEIEKQIADAAKEAITSYEKALNALRDYNDDVCRILDKHIDRIRPNLWTNIRIKSEAKQKLVEQAESAASRAEDRIKDLDELMDDPKINAPDSLKTKARNNSDKVLCDIQNARRQLDSEKQKSGVTERYWQKVQDARQHFKEELEAFFPNIDIDKKRLDLDGADLDVFLLHAFHHVLQYQKELCKLETLGEKRIKDALEAKGQNLNKSALEARIQSEVDKQKRILQNDLNKKIATIKAEQERDAQQQLKKQIAAHSDHLKDYSQTKELEIKRRAEREFDERLSDERRNFNTKLASMIGKLQGLEAALKTKAEADKNAHQAHSLFSACQSLFRALRSDTPRPLEPEIKAIKGATDGSDPLVNAVIQSIPSEAATRGVMPEACLREKFLKLEKAAKKVALVPEKGGSLPKYALSYTQSLLMVNADNPIPAAELEDKPVCYDKMDTYEILQRARYYMERGNLSQALKYVNLLKGAPRSIACDWIKEARIYLETQQAVDVLMAHASATGLMFLG